MRPPAHGIRSLRPLPRRLIVAALAVVAVAVAVVACPSLCRADDPGELINHRTAFNRALLEIDIASQASLKSLRSNYLDALTRLEKQREAAGDSTGVAAIQREKALIAAGDSPGDQDQNRDQDPATADHAQPLRAVYLKSLQDIRAERLQQRMAKRDIYQGLLETLLAESIKAGRLEHVLATKAEIASLATLADSSPETATASTAEGSPAAAAGDGDGDGDGGTGKNTATSVERLIALPTEWPPPVDDPFAKTKWEESMTVPAGSYRLRDSIGIGGHRKSTLVYFEKGSEFSYAEGKFHLWGGRVVAEQCRFSGVPFRADHTGSMYFVDCRFKDCNIREQGNWWGSGNYDSKWYFENCVIEGSLHNGMFNVHYLGLCMTRCSLSRVELPGVWYREGEPAGLRENKWLTVSHCRFEKCKVPLSFLSITSDCAFIDCRFEDDVKEQTFSKPFEVTFYTQGCTNTIRNAPEIITLIEKPLSGLNVPYGSILAEE